MFLFFFFSSRRRHTRSLRDWSSDVCSSDLPARIYPEPRSLARQRELANYHRCRCRSDCARCIRNCGGCTNHGRESAGGIWKDRKSTRLNSSHVEISYAVFCLKKKTKEDHRH